MVAIFETVNTNFDKNTAKMYHSLAASSEEAHTPALLNYQLTSSTPSRDKLKTEGITKFYDLRLRILMKEASIKPILTRQTNNQRRHGKLPTMHGLKTIKAKYECVTNNNTQDDTEQLNSCGVTIAEQTSSTNPGRKPAITQKQARMHIP